MWSGDFGMDQYVSWCLPTEALTLDVIWTKYEDFSKPQTNGVRARFDKRNQYLRARLDTCASVNIMPASVYKLVFQDLDCKNLAPS